MSLSLEEHLLVAGLNVMVRISLNACMLIIRDADVLLLFPLAPFSVTVMPKRTWILGSERDRLPFYTQSLSSDRP